MGCPLPASEAAHGLPASGLTLSRKEHESIVLTKDGQPLCRIRVRQLKGNRVLLNFAALPDIQIARVDDATGGHQGKGCGDDQS